MHQIELLGIHFINHWCGEFFRIFFFCYRTPVPKGLVGGWFVCQTTCRVYVHEHGLEMRVIIINQFRQKHLMKVFLSFGRINFTLIFKCKIHRPELFYYKNS